VNKSSSGLGADGVTSQKASYEHSTLYYMEILVHGVSRTKLLSAEGRPFIR